MAGALISVEKKFTKKDSKPFAVLVLEDLTGAVEVPVWNETFTKCASFLEKGRAVAITGRLDKRDETPRVVASEISALKRGVRAEPILMALRMDRMSENDLLILQAAIRRFPGPRDVHLDFVRQEGPRLRVRLSSEYRVNPLPELKLELDGLPILDFGF